MNRTQYYREYYKAHKADYARRATKWHMENPLKVAAKAAKFERGHRESATFRNAYQRCNNPKNNMYKYYGGRGIKMLFQSYHEIVNVIGMRPKGMSIDRIDNNGNYEAGNIRWATMKEQAANRRHKSVGR